MVIKKWILALILGLMVFIIATQFFIFSKISRNKLSADTKYFNLSRQSVKVFQPFISDTLSFCGEDVPIDNLIVRERLEREIIANMYWHSHTILLLKRAGRFFPIIEPILAQNNVHDDIKFLAMCESELTNAVSPAGAVGYWQFLKKTGQQYGLEINDEVDERRNLLKSTEAACKYIKSAYSTLGSYSMAAASYNMGISGLIQKTKDQQINNYYNLFLNEETSRYVYRILALKIIYENPLTYGFFIRNKDIYKPIDTREIEISNSIDNLAIWAKENNTSYLELKYLNPWIVSNKLTINNPDKKYIISLPISMSWKASVKGIARPNQIFNDTITFE